MSRLLLDVVAVIVVGADRTVSSMRVVMVRACRWGSGTGAALVSGSVGHR